MAPGKGTLAEVLRDGRAGGPEAPEHLTLKGILSDLGKELGHQVRAGADELGAALLRGHDGFVMYPRQEGAGELPAPEPPTGREL